MNIQRQLQKEQERAKRLEQVVERRTNELFQEQQVRRQMSENYEKILSTMIQALIVTDQNLTIIKANQSAGTLFQKSHGKILGMQLEDVLSHIRISRKDILALTTSHEEETSIGSEEMTIPLYVSLSPMMSSMNTFEGIVCVMSNLSNHKELERQLHQAQKFESIGLLAAGLAHEINTPIQYVRDNTSFIQEEIENLKLYIEATLQQVTEQSSASPHQEKLRQLAEQIELSYLMNEIPIAAQQTLEGAEKVARIVRSMKLFSHPGTKEKIATDLNAIIESAATVTTNEWKYFADLSLTLDPNLPFVSCDSASLGQALLNLIINASHAISEQTDSGVGGKGTIQISSKLEDRVVKIVITDNGIGIPPDLHEKIFHPFFTTKEPGKGTGQGLSQVYAAIVDIHGGTIDFQSQSGKGTTFEMTIPVTDME
ncbi:MAG: PAS domain-containing protein [Bdellovibrionales bacterium]|nr:PAS domain-containing protein [Bdellovibrionales bacterium]